MKHPTRSMTPTRWLLLIAGIVALCAYAWFPFAMSRNGIVFPSPDATANFFWIDQLAEHGTLWYSDAYNRLTDDIVVPRSVHVANGMVKPMSFLGIILFYGAIATVTGSAATLYFTPLLAVLGAWCAYGIFRRVFGTRTALIATLVLLFLAPYWYYASRGLMHNVAFIAFALAGGWLGLVAREQLVQRTTTSLTAWLAIGIALPFGSGALFGLALLTRTSEAPWLAVVMGVYTLIMLWPLPQPGSLWRRIPWSATLAYIAGIGAMVAVLLYYNTLLYGAPLNFGYPTRLNTLVETIQAAGGGTALTTSAPWWDAVFAALFPFEVHPRDAWRNFQHYYLQMFWYLWWPAVIGALITIIHVKATKPNQWIYLLLWIGISGYIILLYGSWSISDNPSGNATIGNSYTRYWLPMYILALPFAARALTAFADGIAWLMRTIGHVRPSWSRGFAAGLITVTTAVTMVIGGVHALAGHEEGLLYMRAAISKDRAIADEALAYIPPDAVVISERFDKFFFPKRRVIVGHLTDNAYNQRYTQLVIRAIPVYYFGFTLPPRDMTYLNERKLYEAGLRIEAVKEFDSGVTLYQLHTAR